MMSTRIHTKKKIRNSFLYKKVQVDVSPNDYKMTANHSEQFASFFEMGGMSKKSQ